MNRRNFLKNTTLATAGVWTVKDSWLTPLSAKSKLIILATNWGFTGTMDAFCAAAKKEGYDGIEVWWPGEAKQQQEIAEAVQKHGLSAGFLCGGWQTNVEEHLKTFTDSVASATEHKDIKPIYVNCHAGRDHFSYNSNRRFIDFALERSAKTGIPIYQETHRGRILFAANIARDYMEKHPQMELTLDISHWCNVHESMLGDQEETISMALDKSSHVHARVGHPEGPQVNDPRAKEWVHVVEQHFKWWDKIVERRKKAGQNITFLTEFGPPTYMPVMPHTQQPVADQWAINVHMMNEIRKRYQ